MKNQWINNNYSIGEVSNIFGIPSKMLRYWDSINLLKPYKIDQINGYRYYSSSQFYLINFIKYLRKLDVSYDMIKTKLNETNIESLEELMIEQINETENKVRELSNIKRTFTSHIESIEEALHNKEVEVLHISQARDLKLIYLEYPFDNRKDFEIAVRKLESVLEGNPTLLISQVSTVFSKDDFINGKYNQFIGISLKYGIYKSRNKYVQKVPENSEYATMRFWGSLNNSDEYYDKLKDFLKKEDYEIVGDVIRKCVAPGTISGKHDHLAELYVPVKKINKKI